MRRLVLAIAGVLVIAMALYPPWERLTTSAPGVVIPRPAGYHLIFLPPEANPGPIQPARSEIRWFDYQSARDGGYSDDEIARFLAEAQQNRKEVYISREDYASYTGKANDPGSSPTVIAPFVRPRPLEENLAASTHRSEEPLGQKGVRIDVIRLLVEFLGAAGVAVVGLALPAGRRREPEDRR
jgi:hypothetical protein